MVAVVVEVRYCVKPEFTVVAPAEAVGRRRV